MIATRFARTIAGAVAAAAAALAGCSSYALRGKVIEGDASWVMVVDANDPRLSGPGVDGVRVEVVLDPQRLNRQPAGSVMSGGSGEFSLPIGEFGAGVLLFDALLQAERQGFIPAEQIFPLPGQDKRVLVMLQRGAAPRSPGRESLIDEARRYRN